MRYFILILLSLLLFALIGNKPKNDLEKNHLKGNVKSLIESEYIDSTGISRKEQKDSLFITDVYEYNEKGNLIADTSYDYYRGKELNVYGKNTYDPNDNLIERDFYDKDYYSGEIRLLGRISYYYYVQGKKKAADRYDSRGRLEEKDTLRYDDEGNEIEADAWYYTTMQGTYPCASKSRVISKFDNKNNLIERIDSGCYYRRTIFEYDKEGNVLRTTAFNYLHNRTIDKQKDIYNYEKFDDHGNWLKKVQKRSDGTVMIYERQIEYYP